MILRNASHPGLLQRERKFEQTLKTNRGFVIKKMRPDGACLFRAVGMPMISVPISYVLCSRKWSGDFEWSKLVFDPNILGIEAVSLYAV